MPFYEGIGLIAEKNAVVIDVGSAYTKVGYAGEFSPRAILPTPAAVAMWDRPSEDELYDVLVAFVHRIYFRHLLVNPKDRRVVLVDALLGPTAFKEVLSRVLFKHYEVLSVLYSPSHLMPLHTLGVQTAIVMDVGHAEATLVPVFEGVPVLKAWQAQPLAAKAVHQRIRELLEEKATVRLGGGGEGAARKLAEVEPAIEISESVVEDIKGSMLRSEFLCRSKSNFMSTSFSPSVFRDVSRTRRADPEHPARRLRRLRPQLLPEPLRAELLVPDRRRRHPRGGQRRPRGRRRGHVRAGRRLPLRGDHGARRAAVGASRHAAGARQKPGLCRRHLHDDGLQGEACPGAEAPVEGVAQVQGQPAHRRGRELGHGP